MHTVTRVPFCTHCVDKGVPADKQLLLGEICLGCGSKFCAPQTLSLPAEVNRVVRSLVESFMFKGESIDPDYQHVTATSAVSGTIPMKRICLRSRVLTGFTCVITWYAQERQKKDLQSAASWDEHLSGLKLWPVPELVNSVGQYLNKSFSMNWWKPLGPRLTARMQTVIEEPVVVDTKLKRIWVRIELSWEHVEDARYLVRYRDIEWGDWTYTNGLASGAKPMSEHFLTMEDAIHTAKRVQKLYSRLDVCIYDTVKREDVHPKTWIGRDSA